MPLWLQKVLAQIVVLAVMFIPVWIFMLLNTSLHPTDFWQGLALLGIWAFLLGGIQLFLLVAGTAISFMVWDSSRIV